MQKSLSVRTLGLAVVTQYGLDNGQSRQKKEKDPMIRLLPIIILLALVGMVACGTAPKPATQPTAPVLAPDAGTDSGGDLPQTTAVMTVTSPVFAEGEPIPSLYSCEGSYISPELHWTSSPTTTQSFVLIMTDPDAPFGTFTHWVLFDIPATTTMLAEDVSDVGIAGANGFGKVGYGGPCPPPDHDAHRYFFRLYALDTPSLGLDAGVQLEDVETAMAGHVLAEAALMGTFDR